MSTVVYRCVCGDAINLDSGEGGTCPNCQREYTALALRDAGSLTVSLREISQGSTVQLAANQVEKKDSCIGQKLDHFHIVEPIGQGGMGRVYRALDESLQRYVALKVIRPGGSTLEDTRQLRQLFQEATAQARVNHPNIAHIYYVGRDSDSPFLAMELVDGETLSEELAAGPVAFDRIIDVAIQVTDALAHAIDFDIIHSDIKPSNILMTRNGTVKLADFGLARRLSDVHENEPISGTPRYLAPEVAAGQPQDARSDMYSLGITLFQMTFGRLPYTFTNDNIQGLLQTHRDAQIEFPAVWPTKLPEGWKQVLARLLSKSPDDRYPNYEELLANLKLLQPMSLPKAGRVQQGLAWLVDMALVNTVAGIMLAPVRWSGLYSVVFPAAFIGVLSPLLAGMAQARRGTTPGKKLFQIRVVDRYGLIPNRTTLAVRMVAQMLPVWANVIANGFELLNVEWLFWVIVPAIYSVTALDAGWAFFRRDGRSFHDIIFKTRVALDAPKNLPVSDRRAM